MNMVQRVKSADESEEPCGDDCGQTVKPGEAYVYDADCPDTIWHVECF